MKKLESSFIKQQNMKSAQQGRPLGITAGALHRRNK